MPRCWLHWHQHGQSRGQWCSPERFARVFVRLDKGRGWMATLCSANTFVGCHSGRARPFISYKLWHRQSQWSAQRAPANWTLNYSFDRRWGVASDARCALQLNHSRCMHRIYFHGNAHATFCCFIHDGDFSWSNGLLGSFTGNMRGDILLIFLYAAKNFVSLLPKAWDCHTFFNSSLSRLHYSSIVSHLFFYVPAF